jgi:hypothetical protein
MTKECDICGGARNVVLPVKHNISMGFLADDPLAPREHARLLPCPQCSNTVQEERVQVLYEYSDCEAQYANIDIIAAIQRGAVRDLADRLLRDGYVRTEHTETDPFTMRFGLSISIGVVHPDKLVSLESRIRESEDSFAGELVTEAKRLIYNWASKYTGPDGSISKRTAAEAVETALREIRRRRQTKGELSKNI